MDRVSIQHDVFIIRLKNTKKIKKALKMDQKMVFLSRIIKNIVLFQQIRVEKEFLSRGDGITRFFYNPTRNFKKNQKNP